MLRRVTLRYAGAACMCVRGCSSKSTHFGFTRVTEEEKGSRVYGVFERVADKYDLMNDAMSVGVHRLWKDYFVCRMSPVPGMKLLDVAGGTGDVALRVVERLRDESRELAPDHLDIINPLDMDIIKELQSTQDLDASKFSPETAADTGHHADSLVTVCDINRSMLEVGRKKAGDLYEGQDLAGVKLEWLLGDAEQLPCDDGSYHVYSIAFGIRNCTHIDQVLREAHRVLAPGGTFMCLEFSAVTQPVLSSLYDLYSLQVIPVLGQVIAGDWHSYQYLVESIRKFPGQQEFKEMIEAAGFKAVSYENLSCGVAAIHVGYKI